MMAPEGPQVLEYNVRMGDPEAQPILMRMRSDLVEMLQAAHEGQLGGVEAHWTPNPAVCVVLTAKGYPGKPEVGKVISGYDTAESMVGVKVFHAGTRVQEHQLQTSGGRVLGVTAAAEDLAAAIEHAYAAVSKIHFEGMHYRRDIGAKGLRQPQPSPGRESGSAPQRLPNAPEI
jgi:phosphoribosylamine--glycine ligase